MSSAEGSITLTTVLEIFFSADMKEQFVYDPLISKRQQYLLATQVRVDIAVFSGQLS